MVLHHGVEVPKIDPHHDGAAPKANSRQAVGSQENQYRVFNRREYKTFLFPGGGGFRRSHT
jgi:hypothetical protein